MTPAERKRRSRAMAKAGYQKPVLKKVLAATYRISERSLYYAAKLRRIGLPDWEALIMDDRRSHRPSIHFALQVAEHGGPDVERLVIEACKSSGVSFARRVWREAMP